VVVIVILVNDELEADGLKERPNAQVRKSFPGDVTDAGTLQDVDDGQ
jgi:hypothetical protein